MKFSSIFNIIVCAIVLYMSYLYISLIEFINSDLKCSEEPCLDSYLNTNPKLQMVIFTTFSPSLAIGLDIIDTIRDFDYRNKFQKDYDISIPEQTKNNGTLFMYVMVGDDHGSEEWKVPGSDSSGMLKIRISEYAVPGMYTRKQKSGTNDKTQESHNTEGKELKPVTHLYEKVHVTLLTEEFSMSPIDIPFESKKSFKINNENKVLPILQTDFFKSTMNDLIEMDPGMTSFKLSFSYNPIGIAYQRLMTHMYNNLKNMQYTNQNIDEIKYLFANISLNMVAVEMAAFLLDILFKVLSFRTDVLFWRRTKTYIGLSLYTTILRAIGLIFMFLYLIDQFASLILLIAALIELWKCKKLLKIEFTICGIKRRQNEQSYEIIKAEKETQNLDKEGMRYLSYVLCPLFLGGTICFLINSPYKDWYSWIIVSLAKSISVFGILFMFPQFYINYKLKSVAALPWHSLTYKAFNAFIDDARPYLTLLPYKFNITCFRDDITFIIFLYQRWVYPIKNSLMNTNLPIDGEETEEDINTQQKKEKQELRKKKRK